MELSIHGDMFRGGEEKYTGTVDIPSREVAKQMGIIDYDSLQQSGFAAAIVRVSPREVFLKRKIERELPGELEQFSRESGLDVKRVYVHDVRWVQPTSDSEAEDDIRQDPATGKEDEDEPDVAMLQGRKSEISPPEELTRTDKIIKEFKNHPVVSWLIVAVIVIGGLAAVVKTVVEIFALFP